MFSMKLLVVVVLLVVCTSAARKDARVYIVNMGRKQHEDPELTTKIHHETLAAVFGSQDMAKDAILYSYKHGFSGFAASMNSEHAEALARIPGVVSVFPSKMLKLQTTHSWDFMGLDANIPQGSQRSSKSSSDVIIGIIDSGIWPEAKSFDDKLMPPIPRKWKGKCQAGESFTPSNCNRKIIGAQYFDRGYVSQAVANGSHADFKSPRDRLSHGTHVASTAAGRLVEGANVEGFGSGTARGGAPYARLAIYKTVWGHGDADGADILQAFDSAIHDGVDILSLSLKMDADDYATDVIAVGAFYAMKHGILVVTSAGNDGPSSATVSNSAPWILTVGASTMDRGFYAKLELGNHATSFQARSLDSSFKPGLHGIVSGGRAATNASFGACSFDDGLDPNLVRGNYVLCRSSILVEPREAVAAVKKAGGAGVVLEVRDLATGLEKHEIPLFIVSSSFATQLASYIYQQRSPSIYINPTQTLFGVNPAPELALFSSRGPSMVSPAILKPDITAPGVDIMAAVPPRDFIVSRRPSSTFTFMSGTSMSCPHVSGVAALVKASHPDWSPSAIKSAIITTASNMDNTGDIMSDAFTQEYANPFGYGAGQIKPSRAVDPGLVYDATPRDYVFFCCSLGYSCDIDADDNGAHFRCPSKIPSASDLNYPSIAVPNLGKSQTVTRVVTNVGPAESTYKVAVEQPHGIKVTIKPDTLKFTRSVKVLPYQVKFEPIKTFSTPGHYVFGSITWSDGLHSVRSPIAIQLN